MSVIYEPVSYENSRVTKYGYPGRRTQRSIYSRLVVSTMSSLLVLSLLVGLEVYDTPR